MVPTFNGLRVVSGLAREQGWAENPTAFEFLCHFDWSHASTSQHAQPFSVQAVAHSRSSAVGLSAFSPICPSALSSRPLLSCCLLRLLTSTRPLPVRPNIPSHHILDLPLPATPSRCPCLVAHLIVHPWSDHRHHTSDHSLSLKKEVSHSAVP